ncbi:MAG TPA: YvcK family protein [Candidatus Megamonas gallistercoris]|nr:YvcK family protein [Candidatus Megamonas gallistercoris]
MDKGPNITVVGGGTGLSVLLRGMKEVTRNVTAVVTVADDGGSSGRLREEFNVIPPGDLRNCLVALADTEPMMEKLFQYRFTGNSDLAGHSFGNLFITAMTEVTGDIEQALKESSRVLAVKGRVFPATTAKVCLSATMDDGSVVDGESQIPLVHKRIKRVHIFPRQVEAVPSTLKAIREAEVIVLGPGSLYTSVIPNLLVEDIAKEIRESSAIKIYICNVMTQPGETDDYTASMHVRALIEHGGNGIVDYVLVNNKPISQEMQEYYAREGQYPVLVDENAIEDLGVKCFKADIIDDSQMIHHDSLKLAHQVMEIYHTLQRDN